MGYSKPALWDRVSLLDRGVCQKVERITISGRVQTKQTIVKTSQGIFGYSGFSERPRKEN